jgi:opacity protein-like surface antigen
MKRIALLTILFLLVKQVVFGEGIITNAYHSAQYTRMLSRNATTSIDAVYYNPAGLIKMADGWHFATYNQGIFTEKFIETGFPESLINNRRFEGSSQKSVLPSAFAVYKKNDLAFSLGFGPVGAGVTGKFDNGLPTFEIPLTQIVPGLSGLTEIDPSYDVTGYDSDIYFNGESQYWGIQFGVTYQVNPVFSLYGGVRYLPARNAYRGSVKNIQLKVGNEYYLAPEWLNQTAAEIRDVKVADAREAYERLIFGADELGPLVRDNATSGMTISELESSGAIPLGAREEIEWGLSILEFTPEEIEVMPVSEVQSHYYDGAEYYNDLATNKLPQTADDLEQAAERAEDQEMDTKQTGDAITPVIGINFFPLENLVVAVKYEMKTTLPMKNNTRVDDLGMFPDGEVENNNIPSVCAVGVGYKANKWLEAQLSYTMYFEKGVEWGYNPRDIAAWQNVDFNQIRERKINRFGMELGLGLQFNITENFALSAGGLYGNPGVDESYQNDFSYSIPSVTAGGGFRWNIANGLVFDAGLSKSFYEDREVEFTDPEVGTYFDTVGKSSFAFSAGISYYFF